MNECLKISVIVIATAGKKYWKRLVLGENATTAVENSLGALRF